MSKKLLANVGNTVVDNYRRYYQEYEGTFITATNKSEDDTLDTSRYIEVTEIWGNTVQDENNLEDIQSIGELYVDDEGNPILDDLGREQYKIEIESCNKNLSNINYVIGYIDANHPLDTDFRFSISLSDLTEYIPPQSNKTTILLPCQLQKVGDVYDRLYWDSEKGRYVVEKKIGVTEFDNENWNLIANKEKVILFGKFDNLLGIEWDLVITGRKNSSLCSLSTWVDVNMISDRNGHRLLTNRQFTIQVVKTDLISEDLEGFKDYLSTKHKILYYPLRNSQLIETNITEKIQLPCYSEKTHVFVNSTVDASMKVLVPYKEII